MSDHLTAHGRHENVLDPISDRFAFRVKLETEMERQAVRCNRRVRIWNLMYYGSLLGSIALGAFAALLPKLAFVTADFWGNDAPAICAAAAALLTASMHAGGFERRWRASRSRSARTHELRILLLDPQADLHTITERLKDVMASYHQEVVGATMATTPARSSPEG